jgi:hypothetical protein
MIREEDEIVDDNVIDHVDVFHGKYSNNLLDEVRGLHILDERH